MNMNDEVICGCLVTAKKKRVIAVYQDLLTEFARLCENAGVTYWVFFGTLLGAVRHKGFIPWDDDVDIMMPRKDFDRLLSMTGEEFGCAAPYFLQNPVTDPAYHQTLVRFRRGDTTAIMDYDMTLLKEHGKKASYNMGLCLSIFPLDKCSENAAALAARKKLAYLLMGIDYRAGRPAGEKPFLHAVCSAAEAVIGAKNIMRVIHWCYRAEDSRGDMVQCLDGLFPARHRWPGADFRDTVMLPFEDITVPAPSGYEHLLADRYGNYMEFPPEEERAEKHDGYLDPDTPYSESIKAFQKI